MNARAALLLLLIGLVLIVLALRPKEQPLRVDVTPAAAETYAPLSYRSPGYRHPWEPIDDPDTDPRTFA